MLKKTVLQFFFSICLLSICSVVKAQKHNSGELITTKDSYTNYVSELKTGQTNIDYSDFRIAYSLSLEFMNQDLKNPMFDKLTDLLNDEPKNIDKIIEQCNQILEVDYTEISIHSILGRFYLENKMENEAFKHKNIATGLKDSILKSGDGKTCKTGYYVVQGSEIFAVLAFLKADIISKDIEFTKEGIVCNKVKVKMNGEKQKIYFDTTVVMAYFILKDVE
ncbi:DUF4919 domain-containing protein [Flavobacterium sp. I3-2]|uniref:DUF4919 domain-containing protein n=1 Tax=Flavobacterium sp. I3-2 TaxID=2748319 RepID=UPI0015AD4534|nr:DUF4919 domain-containing protein [Flavobacterium sp. I3-2]